MKTCYAQNIEAISNFAWPIIALCFSFLFHSQIKLLFTKLISLLDRVSTIKSGQTEVILSDATHKEVASLKIDKTTSEDANFEVKVVQFIRETYFPSYFMRRDAKIQTYMKNQTNPMIIDAIFHDDSSMILLETTKGKKENAFVTSCHLSRSVNFLKGAHQKEIHGILAIHESDIIEHNEDYYILKFDSNYKIKDAKSFENWLLANRLSIP